MVGLWLDDVADRADTVYVCGARRSVNISAAALENFSAAAFETISAAAFENVRAAAFEKDMWQWVLRRLNSQSGIHPQN